jgi:lysophospholipase L1-like esterase
MRYLLTVVAVLLAAGCYAKPAEQPAAPPAYHVVVVGDSYTLGIKDNGQDPNDWPALVWKQLAAQHLVIQPAVVGEGGSGYAQRGDQGHVFGQHAAAAVQPTTDLVVFFGSANDMDPPPEAVMNAVRDTLLETKATAPKARLLVIGPAWPLADPPATVRRVRDIVRDGAAMVGAVFVDPLAEGWLAGDSALMGADGFHPNDAGHRYLANKIRPLIQGQLSAAH